MDTDQYQFYKNAQYRNTRNRKRIFILDVDDSQEDASHLGAGGQFNIDLFEPLIIDKHSEVYLDNFISFNSNISNDGSNSAFVLKINEFNINSNVASSTNNNEIFNSIVIPNEHNTVNDNHSAISHKSKKFNYICDINPGKIGRISGKITNLSGGAIFHGPNLDDLTTYTLSVPGLPEQTVNNNRTINAFQTGTIGGDGLTNPPTEIESNITFLATHIQGTTIFHFSSDNPEIQLAEPKSGNITFTINSTPITFSIDSSSQLTLNNARFIAEFLIISKE